MKHAALGLALAFAVAIGPSAGCDRGPDRAAQKSAVRAGGDPRIVSLTPSATEIVGALGATALLVGVDDYSTYPPAVTALPKVGSFLSPNLEAIEALHPTLVIVDDIHGKSAQAMEQLGIHTIECPMHALPDVKAALVKVGAALGRDEQARERVAEIDAALDAVAARRPAQRPRVLLVIDRAAGGLSGLVAAGPGSWLDELVAVAGGQNVLAGASVRYPKISREEVIRDRPDVIIDASYSADVAAPEKAWAELGAAGVPAVTQGRVRASKEPFLVAPSPRVAEALAVLEAMLKPPGQ
jgi:iron complex transport system substrate-binding protein